MLRQQQGIEEARKFARLAVTYCSAACQEAVAMVVTELAENIVKYGAKGQGPFAGTVAISVEGNVLRIEASNEVSPSEATDATRAIAQIAEAPDVKTLYRSRLEELFRNPGLARAQLGLLRVAYEGGFRLSAKYQSPTLVVIAERSCEDR